MIAEFSRLAEARSQIKIIQITFSIVDSLLSSSVAYEYRVSVTYVLDGGVSSLTAYGRDNHEQPLVRIVESLVSHNLESLGPSIGTTSIVEWTYFEFLEIREKLR